MAHYDSLADAQESLALTKAFEGLMEYPSEINFTREYSHRSQSYYLEAALRTPFNDDVYFTVESFDNYACGSMLLGGKEYVLARSECCLQEEDFASLARRTVNEAKRLHRVDIWPGKAVVDLYRNISANSRPEGIEGHYLKLFQVESPGLTQFYRGETARGTEISLKVAYGYAVAEVDYGDGARIVYEAGIPHALFTNENERNAFVARAFGELLEMGEI